MLDEYKTRSNEYKTNTKREATNTKLILWLKTGL